MSALITPYMCDRAWEIVEVAVKAAAQFGVTNKLAGTIVVLDPTVDYYPASWPGVNVLWSAYITTTEDHLKYDTIAKAKAHLSWRTGRSSREIQQVAPHLYKQPVNSDDGDVKWGGSVVRDGLVVAFSGVQAVYDEWIAGMMADLLIAMCRDQMTKPGGIMANEASFVTRDLSDMPQGFNG